MDALNLLEYRFDWTDPRWKGFLLENGFVVLKYLPKEAADGYMDRMWGLMEELSFGKVNRAVPSTRKKASNYPYMMHGGMIQYLGHSQLQWDIREACAPVFAELYNTIPANLSSSFDGLCFMDGERKYNARSDIEFIHVDQAPSKQFQYSIQGLLNLADNGPTDGGFVCVPGSHKYVEYWEGHPQKEKTTDWYLFTDEEKAADPMFKESVKVCAGAGDMILWDSRTWHCNTTPTPTSKGIRACVYVCMLPKQSVTMGIRNARKTAVTNGRVSSHHPGYGFKPFPKKPRWCGDGTYLKAVEIQARTVMTPLQKILADVE